MLTLISQSNHKYEFITIKSRLFMVCYTPKGNGKIFTECLKLSLVHEKGTTGLRPFSIFENFKNCLGMGEIREIGLS